MSSESELTEAEIYQTLLGFVEVNSLISFVSLRDETLTREEARTQAKQIKEWLDKKLMAAQKRGE